MRRFFKKRYIITFVIVLVAFFVYSFLAGDKEPLYDFITVQKGELIQQVSITGRVEPAKKVDLAFKNSDRVAMVYVDVGDTIEAGKILVSLDNLELNAELANKQAGLESEKANLKQFEALLVKEEAKLVELKKGTRLEEIQIQEAKVNNAEVSFQETKKNMVDKLEDAYTKSDDAIRNKVDQFFNNSRTSNPDLQFEPDSQTKNDLEFERVNMGNFLISWVSSLLDLTISSELSLYINEARANLNRVKLYLNDIAFALNGAPRPSNVSQVTFDGWKSDVSTARTNVNTAIANISSAEEELNNAESNLLIENNELILKKAGSTPEEILAQEASVGQVKADLESQKAKIKQAQANVQIVQAKLAQNILRSPIKGIVTVQDAKIGEIISANTVVVSIISESGFEVKADVPEADIAKVKVGDIAEITLDAYGDDVIFLAYVTAIDPAETIIEGVASYKTTLYFNDEDERIRPGMTANIDVMTAKRENVISIPRRAVIFKDSNKFVRILKGNTIIERNVVTGLSGISGQIEIVDGLSEGDRVITSFKKKK